MELYRTRIPGVIRTILLHLKKIFPLLFLVTLPGFASAQKTGISGQLYWHTSQASEMGHTVNYNGVPLEIFIHTLTTMAEVDVRNGIINKIYTPIISRFFCNRNGSFKTKIPPGEYSVFVKYQNGFYGNIQDRVGNISPATITAKRNAWITITIDYTTNR